ncbi:MAG TPA: pantoate--beta-alanine ligase [Gemmatimonadaceae bacterium]|nr:pantoate--beta-alanine ligase [Gemmatimonadaceae bacterium]
MIVVSSIAEVKDAIAKARDERARVGFVPTMGALHDGHMSLVDCARRQADVVVMSIFVNPLQFGAGEDLSRYPRPVEEDERRAKDAGVDVVFRPTAGEMYSRDRSVGLTAGELGSDWEGKSRPGHFDGVLTVVAKLFNIVQPDVAVFGRKDLQQASLVKALVRDLNIPVSIVIAPVVREEDGLAMSSRNRYLSADERQQATILNRSLSEVRVQFAGGVRDTAALEAAGLRVMASEPRVQTDYFAVVEPATFKRHERAAPRFAAIVAARLGSTRLIDNMTVGPDDQD